MSEPVSSGDRRRVLVYTNALLPYSETFIRDQAEALSRYGVHYVGGHRVDGLPLPDSRVTVVNDGSMAGSAREFWFKVSGRAPALVRELRAERPAVLHAHFGGCAAVALPLAETLDLPFVVTYHGLDATRTKVDRRRKLALTPQLYVRRVGRLQRRANRFVTITEHVKQALVGQGFPADKIAVLPLGIDTAYFAAAPEVDREPVVLFVGRLVEKKGAEYLIRAMAHVERAVPGARLVVVGDGPLRAPLEAEAGRLLQGAQFLGRQPPAEVRAWMSRARVFCVPSVTATSGDREGFGVVFLEAQAMGTPIVSSCSGGIPEAVADGETGFLLPERDVEGLAARITALLSDDATWGAMSQRGQDRVRSKFDTFRLTRRLEALYDEVIHEHDRVPLPA